MFFNPRNKVLPTPEQGRAGAAHEIQGTQDPGERVAGPFRSSNVEDRDLEEWRFNMPTSHVPSRAPDLRFPADNIRFKQLGSCCPEKSQLACLAPDSGPLPTSAHCGTPGD